MLKIYYYIREYNNSPLSIGYSPAQLLLNRSLKTNLPIYDSNFTPKLHNKNIMKQLEQQQTKQNYYYNKQAKNLPPLENNENILIQTKSEWVKGKVIRKYNNRSYIVMNEQGNQYRRNRVFLRKTRVNVNINPNYDLVYDDYDLTNVNNNPPVTNNENANNSSCSESSRPKRNVKQPAYLSDYI